MDLLERGLTPAANIVFNRYLAETRRIDDLDALATLPFFLSMRAAIRAKVTAARLERAAAADRPPLRARRAPISHSPSRRSRRRTPQLRRRRRPLRHRQDRCSRGSRARSEPMPGAVIVRSDVERKALFGLAKPRNCPPIAYDRRRQRPRLCSADEKARRILAAGHSAIVDAVFAVREERAACGSDGENCREHAAARTVSHRRPDDQARPRRRRARATPPTPTPAWRWHRSVTTSDRSNGRLSMPPERRQPPWRGQAPRCPSLD